MKSKLNVFVNQLKAGELWLDHQRRFCFQYDKNWINSKDSYRLSISLPLRETAYLNDDSYSYFTNLLPEGKILDALSRKLQIPVSNQFELLRAIGGDCAGAVSLFEDGSLPTRSTSKRAWPLRRTTAGNPGTGSTRPKRAVSAWPR